MKYFLLLISLTITLSINAQTPAYEKALEDFKTNYNNKDAQAVFDMFSFLMQKSVNLQTTTQIVASFQMRYGDLKAYDFTEKQGLIEIYIAHFERGKQFIHLSLNTDGKMTGLLFKPFVDTHATGKIDRNITKLGLPFKGQWFTFWGGDTKPQNYHVIDRAQRSAFDFLIIGKNNKTYERSGTRNEDYYAFGKRMYAVCDAEVINVSTGVEDNKPGTLNPRQPLGNSITLKTGNDEYIIYAHFEIGTLKVKKGDRVVKGQFLGNCGNSGNSSEPHLHLHIQDGPNIYSDIGVKCYFESIMVNGELMTDYSPVRLDRISSVEE